MDKILLYIIAFFFMLGAIDYLLGNKMKFGEAFNKGLKTMGPLALSMVGILSITPLIARFIESNLSSLSGKLGIDLSIISSSIIAVDMGGYNIANAVADSKSFVIFSGILMSSILGCTLSFTLPLALGLVKEEHYDSLTKGFLCGLITVPLGLLLGGIFLKIKVTTLIINLIPIVIIAIILALGIMYKPKECVIIFKIFGKGISFIGIVGLIIQGFSSILGITLVEGIMPLEEALTIVGKIAIFLGGAYVMINVIERLVEGKVKGNKETIAAFLGSLASAIIVFDSFDKLDKKGRVVCTAFSVSGAYVLGGQLGYVASMEKDYILLYIAIKLLTGALAVALALFLLKIEEGKSIL